MFFRRALALAIACLLAPLALPGVGGVATADEPEAAVPLGAADGAGLAGEASASVGATSDGEARDGVTLHVAAEVGVAGPAGLASVGAEVEEGAAEGGPCPEGMVHVVGDYCTEVRHECTRWLDDPKLQYARCAEYAPVARCVGQRIPMSFCIDQYEYTAPGDALPLNDQSFMTASKVCKEQGKRLCTEREWNFACEGEQMLPYPYGWSRQPKCNQDREDLYEKRVVDERLRQVMADRRAPAGEYSECVSPFGVHDMVGNLDEVVLRDNARFNPPFRNGLKGGWWMAGRNRCRPATTAHDDYYHDIQVGVRCCSDLPGALGASG